MRALIPCLLLLMLPQMATAQYYGTEQPPPEDQAKLLELLDSPEPAYQYAALLALQWGPDDKTLLLEKVRPLLKSERPYIRAQVVSILGSVRTKESLTELIVLLDGDDLTLRRAAADALAYSYYGFDKATLSELLLPAMLRHLRDGDQQVRNSMLMGLANLDTDRSAALPHLIALLREPTDDMYGEIWEAQYALGQIGEPALAPLLELLQDADAEVQTRALNALSNLSAARYSPAALETLLDYARRAEGEQLSAAWHAVVALARPDPDAYIRVLDELTKLPPAQLALSLPDYWQGAPPARIVPAARALLASSDGDIRLTAARRFMSWEGELKQGALEVVRELLLNPETADAVTQRLPYLGEDALSLVQPLLDSADAAQRLRGMQVLAQFGGDASAYLPELLALAADPGSPLYGQALTTLVEVGNYSYGRTGEADLTELAPHLIKLVGDPKTAGSLHRAALQLLASIKPTPNLSSVLPIVINDLQSDELRDSAMMLLAALGPEAMEAVPMLSQLAGQPETRDMAQWALKAIIGGPFTE